MKQIKHLLTIGLTLGLGGLIPAGTAQANPAFTHASDDDQAALAAVSEVAWKANAQAGLILTTGNARTTTMSLGAKASRKAAKNKFQLEAGGAFARTSIFEVADTSGDGALQANEINRVGKTAARTLVAKARYDRFLTKSNALYVTGQGLSDKPAGKAFVGGGQVGYSRSLSDAKDHDVVLESGYDLSYENPVSGDSFLNHSIRVFVGYEGKVTKETGVTASLEGLFNVNELDGVADRFEDRRFHAKLGLTTKLFEDISFRFGFEAKHDAVPSALPAFSVPFADGYAPLADGLDTKTEATIIVSFL